MINATNGGPSYTWSSIALTDAFQKAEMPMPLVVADGRYPGELLISSNATVYEFNPWEFGTFDPTVFGFAPLEYLGTKFNGGSVPSNESCVRGFDNVGFVMGTSSTLFNQFLLQINSTALPDWLKSVFTDILKDIGENDEDIAQYAPNPFYHFSNTTNPSAAELELDLVDGGEDLQNIPLHPLIQPERHVDVIFAVDSSADTTYSWPNGTALVATYERSLNSSGIANGTSFPAIPDQNTFVNKGLNTRPTFFGCNSSNTTGPSPLIVYLPNYPYTAYSNFSTFQPDYTEQERDSTILNGYDVVTMGNSTRDGNWSTCVGCAILSRSLERTNTNVPEICKQCFQRYCWDGSLTAPPLRVTSRSRFWIVQPLGSFQVSPLLQWPLFLPPGQFSKFHFGIFRKCRFLPDLMWSELYPYLTDFYQMPMLSQLGGLTSNIVSLIYLFIVLYPLFVYKLCKKTTSSCLILRP